MDGFQRGPCLRFALRTSRNCRGVWQPRCERKVHPRFRHGMEQGYEPWALLPRFAMTLLIRPWNELDGHASGHFNAACDSRCRITLTGELDITQLDTLRGVL